MIALFFIITVAFGGALFELIHIELVYQKIIIMILSLIIIVLNINNKIPSSGISLVIFYILYLMYAAISAYAVSGTYDYVLMSLVPLSIGLFFYFGIIEIKFSTYKVKIIYKFLLIICLFQICFSIIKLFFYGIDEKFLIGTMSHTAGQLGFLFPAVAVPVIFYFMWDKKKGMLWVLTACLFGFGIINEKRSIVYLMPIIIYFSILANKQLIINPSGDKTSQTYIFAIPLILIGIVFGISFIPSLNPDQKYGGYIDILYLFEYAFEYLTMDYGGKLQGSYELAKNDINIQVGRVILFFSIIDWWINSDWFVKLFGIGFGAVTPSNWLGSNIYSLFDIIGTRGAISGAGVTLIETGITGLILFILFFMKIYYFINKLIYNSSDKKISCWGKTTKILFWIFIFDYFFYSTVLLRTMPMPIIFFAMIGSLAHLNRNQKKL